MRTLITILMLAVAAPAAAASKQEIDAEVKQALADFRKHTAAGNELSQKAAGVLVFPSVVKAGIGIGGEFGEGALVVKGKTVAYYNIAAASIGLQLGVQARSEIVLFMNDKVLADFRKSDGWKAGVMAAWRWPRWARAGRSTPRPRNSRSSASSFRTRA